jgi:hypothetical protein
MICKSDHRNCRGTVFPEKRYGDSQSQQQERPRVGAEAPTPQSPYRSTGDIHSGCGAFAIFFHFSISPNSDATKHERL